MGGIDVETEVEVIRVGGGPRGGGRALVHCPACGRRCRVLWPSLFVVLPVWEDPPQPITISPTHIEGWFKLPALRLRHGARQIAWACRSCSGTRGSDARAGHKRRLRHIIGLLRSHPLFGRRREGESWRAEKRRQGRLAKAEAELTRLDQRGLATLAGFSGIKLRRP